MNIQNCFVVYGAELAPQVHLLDPKARAALDNALSLSLKRGDRFRVSVYQSVFGHGVEAILPAWSVECMVEIAERYEGPYQTELRGLCAAIALGKPYGPDAEGKSDDGGRKAPIDPVKPKPRRPSGGTKLATPIATTTGEK